MYVQDGAMLPKYTHTVFIYIIWVSRAGNCPINVELDSSLLPVTRSMLKNLQDTVIPYRVRKLDIILSQKQLSKLSDSDFDIEELAVTLTDFPKHNYYSRDRIF